MKQIAAGIVLLALATPAAASSAAIWDCGNGVTVTSSRNQFAIAFNYGPDRNSQDVGNLSKYQLKGVRRFHFEWGHPGSDIRLNGRTCKQTN